MWNKATMMLLMITLGGWTMAGEPEEKTIEGEVIDMGCYTSREARGEEHADCAARCLSGGTPAGILTDDGELYTIAGPAMGYSKYAAKTIRLTGSVRANAIRPQKMEVKEEKNWQEVALQFGSPKTDD